MLRYERSVEIKRRPWQRHIEVFSPKIKRRVTLLSREAHDAWLLLEADPSVRSFCERPAYVEGAAGRMLEFWVDEGRHAKFWIITNADVDQESLPSAVNGVALRPLVRADMVALAVRIANWAQIVPYLISFLGQRDRRLQKDLLVRLVKPHRLERIEAAFHPIDVDVVRASLFELLATGDVIAPEIDVRPLGLDTVFKRPAA